MVRASLARALSSAKAHTPEEDKARVPEDDWDGDEEPQRDPGVSFHGHGC
jgi:hypothetical protein